MYTRDEAICLDGVLGLGTRAAGMGRVCVARKLDHLGRREAEDGLEAAADLQESLPTLLGRATLATGHVAVATARDALAYGAGPDADAIEGLAHVDDDAHDLAVVLVLERLADGPEHHVQPQVVDVDVALLLELVAPLAAVLVLRVLPLGPHALLEQVVVRLERKVRDGRDVVLLRCVLATFACIAVISSSGVTHIYSPEFLDRVERDDLLQEIVPVVALQHVSHEPEAYMGRRQSGRDVPFQKAAW